MLDSEYDELLWNEEHRDALHLLATIYLDQGHTEKGICLLEALDVMEPHHPPLLKTLSYAYIASGHFQKAFTILDALLRLSLPMPENAPLLLLQARALWGLGRTEEATDTLNRYYMLRT